MSDFAAVLGQRIQSARTANGWTQQQLADELGCTQTAVSYWESGKRSMSAEDLVRVAEALGAPGLLMVSERSAHARGWAEGYLTHAQLHGCAGGIEQGTEALKRCRPEAVAE